MTREEAKEFAPILQAFAEGKVIECRTTPSIVKGKDTPNNWTELKEIEYWNNTEYRIKLLPTHRPFKDAKECWDEMLKHQPFGWVKRKGCDDMENISYISNQYCGSVDFAPHTLADSADLAPCSSYSLSVMFEVYSFADGTPFGIKMEE